MFKGSCACGRIQYQTQGHPLGATACHCSICQRVSGAPYLGFVDFEEQAVQWSQQPDIWQASDLAERGHCKVCGTSMSMRYFLNKNRISVTLGSITTAAPALPRLEAHIFLQDKAPYFVLAEDGVQRMDGFPEDFETKLAQWKKTGEKV
jgi:hypothetical protein